MARWLFAIVIAAACTTMGCASTQATEQGTVAAKEAKKSRFQPMPMITYYQPIPYGPLGPPISSNESALEQRRVDLGAR